MNPSGFLFHQLRQGIHVGAFQFAQHPVFENQRHHGVISLEFLQHRGICAEAGFGSPGFLAVEAESVEQQLAELFGRGEIEICSRRLFGLLLKALQGVTHLC